MSEPSRTPATAPSTWPIQPGADPARPSDAPTAPASEDPAPPTRPADTVTSPVPPADPPTDGPRAAATPGRPAVARSRTLDRARTWLEGRPLRTRLVAILVVVLVTALVASGYAAQLFLRTYLLDRVDADLKQEALRATATAYEAVLRDDPLGRFGPERDGLPGGYVVRYWFPGTGPVTYPATGLQPRFPTLTTAELSTPRTFTVGAVSGTESWRVYATTWSTVDRTQVIYAQVAAPLREVDRTLNQLRALLTGLGLAVVALGALLGAIAIRRAFRPLGEVETTAAAIAAGDLSRRIPERPTTTEVGRLTASLNTMLSHIESAFRAREASEARTRRFAADASHELRTPLASIRGFAELYRQGAVPSDEVPRTMQRIEDEATRMGGLVEDLLLLARLDEQRAGRSERVDLTVLAGDAVHDAKGLDAARAVRLVGLRPGEGPASSVVVGDEDRLRQVVANLVANAVRHTPPGTPVEVAVGVDEVPADDAESLSGPVAVLEVRDHGHGLTREQAERIFERFYRVDSSRRRGRGGGSGLGLSIVSAVVSAHGGQVGVRMTPGGGATFRVVLPAAPDAS